MPKDEIIYLIRFILITVVVYMFIAYILSGGMTACMDAGFVYINNTCYSGLTEIEIMG